MLEGKMKKGGLNEAPNSSRPEPPKPQGIPFLNILKDDPYKSETRFFAGYKPQFYFRSTK